MHQNSLLFAWLVDGLQKRLSILTMNITSIKNVKKVRYYTQRLLKLIDIMILVTPFKDSINTVLGRRWAWKWRTTRNGRARPGTWGADDYDAAYRKILMCNFVGASYVFALSFPLLLYISVLYALPSHHCHFLSPPIRLLHSSPLPPLHNHYGFSSNSPSISTPRIPCMGIICVCATHTFIDAFFLLFTLFSTDFHSLIQYNLFVSSIYFPNISIILLWLILPCFLPFHISSLSFHLFFLPFLLFYNSIHRSVCIVHVSFLSFFFPSMDSSSLLSPRFHSRPITPLSASLQSVNSAPFRIHSYSSSHFYPHATCPTRFGFLIAAASTPFAALTPTHTRTPHCLEANGGSGSAAKREFYFVCGVDVFELWPCLWFLFFFLYLILRSNSFCSFFFLFLGWW